MAQLVSPYFSSSQVSVVFVLFVLFLKYCSPLLDILLLKMSPTLSTSGMHIFEKEINIETAWE